MTAIEAPKQPPILSRATQLRRRQSGGPLTASLLASRCSAGLKALNSKKNVKLSPQRAPLDLLLLPLGTTPEGSLTHSPAAPLAPAAISEKPARTERTLYAHAAPTINVSPHSAAAWDRYAMMRKNDCRIALMSAEHVDCA